MKVLRLWIFVCGIVVVREAESISSSQSINTPRKDPYCLRNYKYSFDINNFENRKEENVKCI